MRTGGGVKTRSYLLAAAVSVIVGAIWLGLHLTVWPGHGEGQNTYILFFTGGFVFTVLASVFGK